MFWLVPRARVLVVDHDPDMSELLAHSLRRAGLSTVTARDTAEALDLIGSTRPDLVVLGLDIGTMAGLEALRAIRRHSQAHVILLGSVYREEDVIRGLDLGADDYLVKPFSFPELLARIRARLRRAAMQPTNPISASPRTLRAGSLTLDPARWPTPVDNCDSHPPSSASWNTCWSTPGRWCRRAPCWKASGAASTWLGLMSCA
jgi:DNA-binding response OmpR family regulator